MKNIWKWSLVLGVLVLLLLLVLSQVISLSAAESIDGQRFNGFNGCYYTFS